MHMYNIYFIINKIYIFVYIKISTGRVIYGIQTHKVKICRLYISPYAYTRSQTAAMVIPTRPSKALMENDNTHEEKSFLGKTDVEDNTVKSDGDHEEGTPMETTKVKYFI